MKILIDNIPINFGDYYEPFLGGGSLFFRLYEQNKNNKRTYYLSDINEELMNCYNVISKEPHKLIDKLKVYKREHTKDFYYKERAIVYENIIDKAARFLYLMKTCFNGLYRVNSKNLFNTPIGSYKNPLICDEENILMVSDVLKNKVVLNSFSYLEIQPGKGDFVYFDPPYDKVKNDSFTMYSKNKFLGEEQIKLRDFCIELDKKGVYWLLSNSNTEFIRDLYKDFKQNVIEVPRFINSSKDNRGKVEELLIKNY